jgi:hypothetical protein
MGKNWDREIARSEFINKTAFDLTRKNGSFALANVVEACETSGFGNNVQDIRGDLIYNCKLVVLPQKDKLRFFNREALFAHAEFLVKLTEFELKNKIFIVGHRLMPFLQEDPGEVFWDKNTNERIPEKNIKISFRELNEYYCLYHTDFGALTEMMYSTVDWSSYIKNKKTEIRQKFSRFGIVTCYDLSAFMSRNKLSSGDYLKISFKDYKFEECNIEPCPASLIAANSTQVAEWKNKFESGLTQAINYQKQHGGELLNNSLMAAAFYYGGNFLLENPIVSWFDILRESDKFSLQCIDCSLFIWDKSPLRKYMWNEIEYEDIAEFPELEYMGFAELTALMGYRMYEANTIGYMLDFIYSVKTLRETRKYCFVPRFDNCRPVLKERFNKMIIRLWRRAKRLSKSEMCSPEVIKCRKEMMQLRTRMLTFIRKLDALDIAPKDLYSEKIATMDALLREIVGHFSDLVTSRFPDKKLKEANRVIKKVSSRLDITIRQLERKFMSKPTTREKAERKNSYRPVL